MPPVIMIKNLPFIAFFAALVPIAALSGCKSNAPSSGQPIDSPPVSSPAAPAPVAAMPARVEVGSDGFQPSRVRLVGGRQIIFKRTSDSTCATAVVFPELGIEKPLPLNVDVPVDLPASAQGEVGFQCGMGMYKSKVVAE
jgi:hypothetical protein